MSLNNFKINFNFYTNIMLLTLILFGGLVWADSNGIWNEASDLRGGIIGSDEQDVTSNFTFINPIYFTEDLFYKNQELDLRYVNENGTELDGRYVNEGQANSITSEMIGDGQVNSDDIADGSITSSDVDTNSIQTKLVGTCSSGDVMYGITSAGAILCKADAVGSSGGSGSGCVGNQGYSCCTSSRGCEKQGIIACDGTCQGQIGQSGGG